MKKEYVQPTTEVIVLSNLVSIICASATGGDYDGGNGDNGDVDSGVEVDPNDFDF